MFLFRRKIMQICVIGAGPFGIFIKPGDVDPAGD